MLRLLTTKGAKRKIEEGFNRIVMQNSDYEGREQKLGRKARNLLEFYSAGL